MALVLYISTLKCVLLIIPLVIAQEPNSADTEMISVSDFIQLSVEPSPSASVIVTRVEESLFSQFSLNLETPMITVSSTSQFFMNPESTLATSSSVPPSTVMSLPNSVVLNGSSLLIPSSTVDPFSTQAGSIPITTSVSPTFDIPPDIITPTTVMMNTQTLSFTERTPIETSVPSTASSSLLSIIQSTPTNIPSPSPSPMTKPTTESVSKTERTPPEATLPPAAVIGIVIGGTITIIALSLTAILLVCFCCCCIQSKKYEYRTGNEYRMTVQQWNITSAHYNMNRADSVSSISSSRSRGSSILGSLGFMRRYSNSADHVSSIINQSVPDLYSTPV